MRKFKISSLIILFTVLWVIPCYAQSAAITNGMAWLSGNQNADGSWGKQTELILIDTTEAINAFKYSNNTSVDYTEGINWLLLQDAITTDELSRKIISLADAGVDTSALVSALISYKNTDGGWGLSSDFDSDPLTTSLSLQALKAANYSDSNTISTVLGYLISNQNPDGGFGFYSGDDSNVYMTAMVSYALRQFTKTTSTATAINKATSYLIPKQQANGGWGTVYETALTYIALVGVTTDNTVLGNAVNYLILNQSSDGSWLQDAYSTSLALRAIYLSENRSASSSQTSTIEPTNTAPSASSTIISGKVTDASNANPIAGADVAVTGASLSGKTDSAGAYTISGITQLEFNLKASATGYDSLTYSVKTTGYGAYTVDFALNQSKASDIRITSITTDKGDYGAYTDVTITGVIENRGSNTVKAIVIAQIEDVNGNTIAMISPSSALMDFGPLSSKEASLTFNTGNASPGDYKVTLQAKDSNSNSLLSEVAAIFRVLETINIESPRVLLSPQFSYVGATNTLTLPVSFNNRSNVTVELSIEHEMKTPSGAVISSGATAYSLTAEDTTPGINLAAFDYVFKENGGHPVEVKILNGTNVLGTATNVISIASETRIEPTKTLTPESVIPEGDKKIRINIKLKGK